MFANLRSALGFNQWPWSPDDVDTSLPVRPRGNLRSDGFYSDADKKFPHFQNLPWTDSKFDVARFDLCVLGAMATGCLIAAAALGKYGLATRTFRSSTARFIGWLRNLFRLRRRSGESQIQTTQD